MLRAGGAAGLRRVRRQTGPATRQAGAVERHRRQICRCPVCVLRSMRSPKPPGTEPLPGSLRQ
jgi:hypothetical protein